MKYLLDTHTLIWYITDDNILPIQLADDIEKAEVDYAVSIVSLWEIGIKYSIEKLILNLDIIPLFKKIQESKINILQINTEHILKQATLPFHHRDPFDRLLIAQAQVEYLTILTKNGAFNLYDVPLRWN